MGHPQAAWLNTDKKEQKLPGRVPLFKKGGTRKFLLFFVNKLFSSGF
ncbi:hypothetical protein SXCC_04635 [Gluconacetobacter sp. SXCC-1]|nr:hypothetical protein SXCC_04635 [Gluconacetobacter sp. SXCC-1]